MGNSFIGKRTRWLYAIIDATTTIIFIVVGVFFIINFNTTSSASDLPDYYNLRDFNDTVPLKNQGDLGLCWAYATLTSTESFLIENGLSNRWNPVLLSEFQLDYALSNNGMNSFKLPYNSLDRSLQSGGSQAFWWLKSGFSPALLSEFGDGYYNQEDTNKLPVEKVIKKQQHAIVDYDHIVDTATKTKEQIIKEHIMKDGAVYVDTSMTANCIAQNLWTNSNNEIYKVDYLIDYTPACNQYETFRALSEGHAMTVIGWDDYYTLDYCNDAPESGNQYKSSSSYALNHCKQVRSTTGAWILQNSWGETIPYPYLSYGSKANFYAPTQYLENFDEVDTIYSQTSILSHHIDNGAYIATFQSSEATCSHDDGCEAIIGLNFENQANTEYDIFISSTGDEADFEYTGTSSDNLEGAIYVDISYFKIPHDIFSIKIVPKNGERFVKYPQVNVFSVNVSHSEDSTTINATLKNENVYPYTDSITLHVSTHLYPQSEDVKNIDIQFLDPQGNNITDNFIVTNIYNIDDDLFADYKVNCHLDYDYITARVFYASISHQLQTTNVKDFQFNITNLEKISEQGTGTISDPYIITTLEQLIAIGSHKDYMSAHYILGADIDFADYSNSHGFTPIGAILNVAFSGSLDGQNHSIKNLKPAISSSNNNSGLFYLVKDADIKNLNFYNCEFVGDYVGALAPKIDSSTISNISIYNSTLSGKVVGSVAGLSTEDSSSVFNNIFSNSTIECEENQINGSCGGLIGEAYLDGLTRGTFSGVINTRGPYVAGGIIGTSGFNVVSDIAVYNYGQWSIATEADVGIIAGDTVLDSWSRAVVVDEGGGSDLFLFSHGSNTDIRNSYIVNRTSENMNIFKRPENASSENIAVVPPERAHIIDEYAFLDFGSTWEIRDGYPIVQGLGLKFFPNSIGASIKYTIDPTRHVISNVKVYSDTGYITKEQFIGNFLAFVGTIYDRDGTTEITSPNAKLASGMLVKNNDEVYTIAILGDCHPVLPGLNAADITCMRRKLGDIEVDSVPNNILKDVNDINKDGEFDITDVVILRRALAKGYPTEEEYVYEQV